MTIYSLDVLLFLFGTSLFFHAQFNCCFLTCIKVSQEAGQVVWYSHFFQNLPQFTVIHTVKGFGIVNKAELDVFLELSCFFHDPEDVGNLISGSSVFSKTREFWALLYQRVRWVQLCGSLSILWHALFGIGMKTDLFQSCDHCWVFQICWCITCINQGIKKNRAVIVHCCYFWFWIFSILYKAS